MVLNKAALTTGGFFVLVFGVHTFMGGQEVLQFRPENVTAHQNWLMKVGAFPLVTIDLLVLAVGLIYASLKFPHRQRIYQAVAGLCFLYGISWFLQVALWQQSRQDFWMLPQWMLFFLAGLGAWVASLKKPA